jgi:hypothetical protein
MLDSNREPRTENVSGPIIALRDEGMEYAIATISTARHGRQREVHVTIGGDDVALAHDWLKEHETVICNGDVSFTPAKGLLMTDPSAFQLLADTILPTRQQEPPNLGLADCWRTPVAALITTGAAAVISEDERAQRHPPAAGLLGPLGSADPRLAVAVANSVAIRQ